jgi:hypothetical protein
VTEAWTQQDKVDYQRMVEGGHEVLCILGVEGITYMDMVKGMHVNPSILQI